MNKSSFVAAWLVLSLVKLGLAWTLPLFGDEAFYWWEGRHLAWSYSDLPPLTAWLTALGGVLLPGEVGIRLPFLLLGALLPWQVVWMTRRSHGEAASWRAGWLALLLPLACLIGPLALPDVPMIVVTVWAVDRLVLALRQDRLGPWLQLGLALAVGLLCHYRFAAVPPLVAAWLLLHPAGRQALRGKGPWLAAAIAALGLLPLLWFNLGHDLAALRFQLVERHPWHWQATGAWQLAEQALVASPLLLALLGWSAWDAMRRRSSAWAERVQVPVAVGLWLVFFVLGFFADNERFRWHWPLPAFVLLLPALADRLPRLGRGLRWSTLTGAALVSTLVLAYLAAAGAPQRVEALSGGKRFPANFSGWREAAHWLRQDGRAVPERLVTDNFMLAAALRFYLPENEAASLRVLDDALNHRHGRAAQLRIWAVDEAALADDPNRPGWLVVEENARRFSDRWAWYQGLCARFSGLRLEDQLLLFDGRKRFVRWRFERYEPRPSCQAPAMLPPLGWVEIPDSPSRDEPLEVSGWVTQTEVGIETVELRWNGEPVMMLERSIELDWVERHWGEVGDPAGHRLGFRGVLDRSAEPRGKHRLSVHVRRGDGRDWLLAEQTVRLR